VTFSDLEGPNDVGSFENKFKFALRKKLKKYGAVTNFSEINKPFYKRDKRLLALASLASYILTKAK